MNVEKRIALANLVLERTKVTLPALFLFLLTLSFGVSNSDYQELKEDAYSAHGNWFDFTILVGITVATICVVFLIIVEGYNAVRSYFILKELYIIKYSRLPQ